MSGRRPVDGRTLRRLVTWASVGLVVAVGAAGCVTIGKKPTISVTIVHGTRRRVVRMTAASTVAEVLDRVDDRPADGHLLSVVKHRRLGSNGRAGRITLGGRTVARSRQLLRNAVVALVDGPDTTEAVETVRRPLQPGGLPDALQHVFAPGRVGEEELTLGVRSREIARRTTIRPAVPAHRATGMVLTLTFDDGPDPRWTPQILDILQANHVQATFCEVGIQVDAHPELSQRILREGHQLCNHTVHHVERLEAKPADVITSEITGGSDAITKATGKAPAFYRPPGGTLAPVIYDTASSVHEQVLYWSIDPRDWRETDPGLIAGNVVTKLQPGSIVLLHDGGGIRTSTVAALPLIIAFARALGYSFTLPISPRPEVG